MGVIWHEFFHSGVENSHSTMLNGYFIAIHLVEYSELQLTIFSCPIGARGEERSCLESTNA
jgi:hypothetical protein